LVLDGPEHAVSGLLHPSAPFEEVHADSLTHLLALLQEGPFVAYLIDPKTPGLGEQISRFSQAEGILESLDIGIAILDAEWRVTWANGTFRCWCGATARGQHFLDALGKPAIVDGDLHPFDSARAGASPRFRLQTTNNSYIASHLSPLPSTAAGRQLYFLQCRDITKRVLQKQKLDALHKAGSVLAGLAPEQLDDMPVEVRIKLLQQNLRKSIHDLLRYDVIEIRMLNRRDNRLEPLVAEGMTPEAAQRVLYALPEGNGVTGYVAATGTSYLCPDTTNDPHYILGAVGAKSSMTVPIMIHDQVIGTFNVESPIPNAFGPDELQFAELFAREIAQALYTLELLSAQKSCAANESLKAVNREIALPVDHILESATAVLARYLGHDPQMAEYLHRIIDEARLIKQNIQKVGDDLVRVPAALPIDGLSPIRLRGKHVLVVDADEQMRRSAHLILERLGCVVETAPTAKAALEIAAVSDYDAVICDVILPDMKGYEAYRRLREAQPKARMILMAGFGYDGGHTVVKARQDGLRFVLYKPFLVNQLVNALECPEPPAPKPTPEPEVIQAS
jgi:CheY-like chemotaxis protein